MAVTLQIQDGSPWWLSPNVWAVPGDDPEGAPGTPIVGSPCYLWAHVENLGTTPVNDAQVRFYWADPSVGFDRTSANLVGSANVTLSAGASTDVLCLAPWLPAFVNGGHECVLAEAFHPIADPLPPTPAFDVPTDRHVAQRNLQVAMAFKKMAHAAFQIHNTGRQPKRFRIQARPGKLEELRPLAKTLGRELDLTAKGELQRIGFVRSACPNEAELEKARPEIEGLEVLPFGRAGLSLVGELKGDAALVHVVQEADGRTVGGLSVLVLRASDRKE